MRAAVAAARAGGTLHVVDFGDMAGLPDWFRGAIAAWLARFQVRYRPEVKATLDTLRASGGLEIFEIARRYAILMRFTPTSGLGSGTDPKQGDAVA